MYTLREIKAKEDIYVSRRPGIRRVVVDNDTFQGSAAGGDPGKIKSEYPAIAFSHQELSSHEDPNDIDSQLPSELLGAKALYKDTIEFAQNMVDGIRSGERLDYRKAVPFVQEILGSISRNPNALELIRK